MARLGRPFELHFKRHLRIVEAIESWRTTIQASVFRYLNMTISVGAIAEGSLPKSSPIYNVGDVVEVRKSRSLVFVVSQGSRSLIMRLVTHTSTASPQIPGDTIPPRQGRLSQLLSTETKSRCWLVQLTDTTGSSATGDSEQVDEDALGKVISPSSSDTESVNLVSSSDGDEPPTKQKRVSFSDDSKSGPPPFRRKPVSRKQSRRKSQGAGRSVSANKPGRKRKGGKSGAGSSSSKRAKVGASSSEPVTKVPMKTGTLYMYGGSNRRAEFVPHV